MTRTWILRAWKEMSADDVYRVLSLRQRVFVVEQRCAYQDADGYDALAAHVWCHDAVTGEAVACARVFAPGVKYTEASLGRVATSLTVRRTGLGRSVVARALGAIAALHGEVPVRISAQAYLQGFYQGFGFVPVGESYLEDEIPHVGMVRGATADRTE